MLRLDINIVWTILNLLIIFAIVKIFLIKPIHKILDARQAEIDKQYADAKAAQDSANELKGQYEASLSGVQAEKEVLKLDFDKRISASIHNHHH